MLDKRIAWAGMALACLMAGSGLAQNQQQPASHELGFPPVGLGSTETAEVNVTNLAANSSSGTAASCSGSVAFLNSAGTAIGTATTFTVTAGQTFSAHLPFASSGGASPRAVIRANITLTVPSTSPRPPCSLESTLQTYDTSSGATHLILTGGVVGYR